MCFLIGTSLDMVLTYNHSAYTYMIYLYLAMHVLGYRLVVCNAESFIHVISDSIGVFIFAQGFSCCSNVCPSLE